LIAGGCRCDVLNCVATLAYITLRHGAVVGSYGQPWWKEVSQENTSCIIATIVSDFDLEGDDVSFIRSVITRQQCFHSD